MAALVDTLDLLSQALDTAFETDLLDTAQYDAVSALVWGVLARYAGTQDGPGADLPVPSPADLAAALDALSEAV